ncbi:golgin subfamily A member 4 isoform X2 [Clupea harengus]|uniref:Golgin subfamily A member 4 isoform X2 n=1 Tax=Clupea harengus TaxID=7950 RepID=A0A6P8G422_CLUHA|nr:golgin subfamily A member 4 isoform X2 [Clupea harengus]
MWHLSPVRTGLVCLCSGVCVAVFVSVSLRRWQESQLGQPKKSNQKKKRKDTQPSQDSGPSCPTETNGAQAANHKASQNSCDRCTRIGASAASSSSACGSSSKTSSSSSSTSRSSSSKASISIGRGKIRSAGKSSSVGGSLGRVTEASVSLSGSEPGVSEQHRGGESEGIIQNPTYEPASTLPQDRTSRLDTRTGIESGYSSLEKAGPDAPPPHQQLLTQSDGCDSAQESQVIGQFERENAGSSSSSSSSPTTWPEDVEKRHVCKKQEPDCSNASSSRFSATRDRRSKSLDRRGSDPTSTPDLINLKKGWMTRLGEDGQWKKHWFVLTDQSLRFYRDSVAEAAADLDGEINMSTCYDVTDFPVQRNFGFQIHTKEGLFTLCAMTSGIRQNWIQVMKKNIRPSINPDVTRKKICLKLSPEKHSCAIPRFVGKRGSVPVAAEKRSHVRERRREGRYKTYDWSEFCLNHLRKEESGATAQSLQDSSSPPIFSPPSSSLSTASSSCSAIAQPISDCTQEGAGVGDETPTNSSPVVDILLPPPTFSLTEPEESERKSGQGLQSDSSHSQRADEERGMLNFDLTEDRKVGMEDEKGDNEWETLQNTPIPSSALLSSSSTSSSSSSLPTSSVQTDSIEREGELQVLRSEMEAERGKGLAQREESQQCEDRLRAELADREQKQKEAESMLQEAESRLRELQSSLERAESALQEREKASGELRSRLEAMAGRLRSSEEAEEQKEQRLKKHLLLLQESQERERRSLGASLELAEQRGQELEERLKRQEAHWAAELQRRSAELEGRRTELDRRCGELAAQLEESDAEVGRLRERLQGEETLYYDLEHNYERVREEMECAKGREQSCEERCRHLLERKECELQEMLVKMAALGNSLEETEQRLKQAQEERRLCVSCCGPTAEPQEPPSNLNTPCPSVLPRAFTGADVRPKVRRGSTVSPSEGTPSAAAGEESDKVISVIQALESKLSDTEERLREIKLHLQHQQEHSSIQIPSQHLQHQQPAPHHRSASGTSTWNPSSLGLSLSKSFTEDDGANANTNADSVFQRGPDGEGVTGQRGGKGPVPDELVSALALVLSKMASALEHQRGELQGRLSELRQDAHKQRSVHGNTRAAHLLFHMNNLGSPTSRGAVESAGEISNACVRAELAYVTHALLTDTLHEEPGRDSLEDECSWGGTGGKPSPTGGQVSGLSDLSPPELTPYQGLEDELHQEDTEPQCTGEEGLVAEHHAQAQALHRLSLQLQTEETRTTTDSTLTPDVLKEALLHGQLIYVAWRARAGVQREVGALRSQYERVVSECQTVCGSMETLFQEQAERYEGRLREESHALDHALSQLEKEREGRTAAESSARQRAEEVQKLEVEFREKLQELQEIHEEEMGCLHGYYAQATTPSRAGQENGREKVGVVSIADLKERINELEEEVSSLKDELRNREERRGDSKAQEANHQRDLESLKTTFECGISSMEESHRRVLEDLRRQHHREVERLKEERDNLLQEETSATISAIEAMRKAHVAELEKTQRRQHSRANTDEELHCLDRELEVLSEQYSHKCLENRQLSRAIEAERQALNISQRENQELQTQNQGLKKRLAAEITHVRSYTNGECRDTTDTHIKDLYQLEVTLRVREAEIQHLKQEISSLKDELHVSTRHSEELYSELKEFKSQKDTSKVQGDCLSVSERFDLMKSRSSPEFWKESSGMHTRDGLSPEEKMKLFESMEL